MRALEKVHSEISKTVCDVLLFNATWGLEIQRKVIDYGKVCVNDVASIEPAELLGNMCVSQDLNSICLKVYRRDVMNFGGERRGLVYSEDKLQSFMLLEHAKSCIILDEVLYYYRVNPSSTTQSGFKPLHVKNMLTVESYISAHANGLWYERRQRDRYLAMHLIRLLQGIRESMGNYEDRTRDIGQHTRWTR